MIKQLAYKKAFLHSLRFPDAYVFGVLLGSADSIDDSIALFHSQPLEPILKIGFEVGQQMEKGQIMGIYEFQADCFKEQVSKFSTAVLQAIASKKGKAFLLKFYLNDKGVAADLALFEKGSITDRRVVEPVHSCAQALLKGEDHWKFSDFESHLENPQLDFCNEFIK